MTQIGENRRGEGGAGRGIPAYPEVGVLRGKAGCCCWRRWDWDALSPQEAGLTGTGNNPPFRRGWREFLAFKRARFRRRPNIAGEGLEGGSTERRLEQLWRESSTKLSAQRGVCGHGIARDAAVPVPLDTGCILSETAGKRWKEERGQPASKCCSPLVLSCWSWTSGKSISLAQVRAQHLDVWERQWLGEGTWKRKS